jgi:DNA polymerase-3 subunit delta
MNRLPPLLADIRQGKAQPIYLFHGEEFLAQQAAREVAEALVPAASRDLNLSILDGASPAEVARDLSTLPMFAETKVVWVQEPEFLLPKKGGKADRLGRLRELWEQGRRREAARRLLALASGVGLDPAVATADDWQREAGIDASPDDRAFCEEAAGWAKEEGLRAPGAEAAELERVLEVGLPPGSHLILSASAVDARLGLVKRLKGVGVEVSFRPAGRNEARDVGAVAAAFLEERGKRLAPKAVAALESLVGGDQVRRLHGELEKLALFVGDRQVIEAADVEQVVERAREVAFLLTNSIERKDFAGAVEGLHQLLTGGGGLPMAVASIATCLRQLLAAREATAATGGRLPGFGAGAQAWVAAYQASGLKMGNPNAAKFRAEAAAKFGTIELARGLMRCAATDVAVKTGGGRLDVERLLWEICQEG